MMAVVTYVCTLQVISIAIDYYGDTGRVYLNVKLTVRYD